MSSMELEDQLRDELDATLFPLGSLLGTDITLTLSARVDDSAESILLRLSDPQEGSDTVNALMGILWGAGQPYEGWWQTDLGKICAQALTGTTSDHVSQYEAARMLGVTRGTVSQLIARGALDRHPEGGVSLSSIYARIGR